MTTVNQPQETAPMTRTSDLVAARNAASAALREADIEQRAYAAEIDAFVGTTDLAAAIEAHDKAFDHWVACRDQLGSAIDALEAARAEAACIIAA